MVLAHLTTVTFDPVTQKLRGFICYPGWMCGPCLRKVGPVIDRKCFWQIWSRDLDLWPSDPKINRVHLLPRTKFEEGRSRRSRIIDKVKRKGYRPTDMCKAICFLFFEGEHKKRPEHNCNPILMKKNVNKKSRVLFLLKHSCKTLTYAHIL